MHFAWLKELFSLFPSVFFKWFSLTMSIFFPKCSNDSIISINWHYLFSFSTYLSFCNYFSVIQLFGLLLLRFGILLLFWYIFVLFPTFSVLASVFLDIFFKVLRPFTLWRALFKGFCLFRIQLSKCCLIKLSKRTYHWSLKVTFLVIKAKMVLR